MRELTTEEVYQQKRNELIESCALIAEGQAEFVAGDTHEHLCHHIASLIRELKL